MDEFNYLLNCDEETILNTWNALGSVTVNNNTKVYTKGSVVRINASKDGSELSKAQLHNNIVYVCEDYRVDNIIRHRALVSFIPLKYVIRFLHGIAFKRIS